MQQTTAVRAKIRLRRDVDPRRRVRATVADCQSEREIPVLRNERQEQTGVLHFRSALHYCASRRRHSPRCELRVRGKVLMRLRLDQPTTLSTTFTNTTTMASAAKNLVGKVGIPMSKGGSGKALSEGTKNPSRNQILQREARRNPELYVMSSSE